MSTIVIDQHAFHDVYREFLVDRELTFFENGIVALDYVRKVDLRKPIELFVICWQANGASTLIHGIRDLANHIPFVVIDSTRSVPTIAAALSIGASAALWKPIEEEKLLDAVRQATKEQGTHPLEEKLRARLIGDDRTWRSALRSLAIAIDNSLEPVLIVGESGVGKELAARAVHDLGHSPKSPLVSVNAATLSPTLLEAELFGYERGAFTDAKETHVGYCGECKDGTLFLDEIGEIPDSLQARLLRVIQERKYRPKMGVRDLPFKGRIVLATNKNLIQEVEAKRFRQDLYQRINVHEIRLPSLRERRNDWLLMAEHFLKEYAPSSGLRLSQEVREILRHYSFPGNTRQLENIIKHVLVHRPTNEIRPHHLPPQLVADACASAGESQTTLAWPEEWMCLPYKDAKERVLLGFDAVYFRKILDRHEGHQANAAKEAGLDPKTFRDKSQKSGL